MEKRFHYSIVVTIARRTHALNKTILLHQIPKGITGILGSPIRVEYKTGLGSSLPDRFCRASAMIPWPNLSLVDHPTILRL